MVYKYIELGEVAEVMNGYAFKSSEFTEEGIPVVKIKNIIPPNISLEDVQYVSEEMYHKKNSYALNHGDILISMTGSGVNQIASAVGKVGRFNLNQKALLNQRVGKIYVSDKTKYDEDFLYYVLSQQDIRYTLASSAGGSANQANINPTQIKQLKIPFPPLDIQKKIGYFLKKIDEKIVVNQSIISILENILKELFKKWFIDFEFPNEQGLPYRSSGGEMAESELGEIPKGWYVGSIEDICNLGTEKVNLDKVDVEFDYIGLEHMPQGSIALNQWESSDKVSGVKTKFNKRDILFGKLRPYFKKVGLAAIDGVCSTDILVMRPKNFYEYVFLVNQLTQDKFIEYTTSTATGTRMPRSGWNQISKYKIVIPSKNLLNNFNEKVLPMLQIIQQLIHENNSLSELRNTLLPKLLSCEIEIPDESVVESYE